jgi:hypothetical protein
MNRELLLEYLYEADPCSHEELAKMTDEELSELVEAYEDDASDEVLR